MAAKVLIAILAAGASRRLGQAKQLVKIDGQTLLWRQCRVALDAGIGPVMVILGCQGEACAAAIADLPVTTRFNENWSEGMAATLRIAATAAIEKNADALLIMHCDQHRLVAADLRKLRSNWAATAGAAACRSVFGEYLGPPVILPSACFEQMSQLQGEEGARRILARLPHGTLVHVEIANARYDLDLPSQLGDVKG
ncbi:MAG TPA: nucleotidyltransferase family protein [Tepidisphaeraceae bacterium]|jgi:molybdenum cofactor cytidylyltransferase|nr:nucleotidyltransferase family protein [Tepidisphaeraceae bacterium]